MKLLKILIRVGLGLLVFIGLILTVRAVFNFTEGRALARTLAGLQAQGIPLTAKDLAPPCPDDDNAARLWKAFENITTIPGRAIKTLERPTSRDSSVRGLISRAWLAYQAGKPFDPADKAALKDTILKNQKAFELVAQMGDKPCFLYRDPAESLVESRLPDAVQMLQTTELLFFSALFSAEEGDVHSAVDKVLIGLKFTPLMAREGTLIADLISVAETRILSQFLGEICGGRAVSDEDLMRLMAAQNPGPWRARLAEAFRGERVMFAEVGGDVYKGRLADLGSIWEGPHWWQELGAWIARPLVKRDMRRSLSNFEFLEAQTKIPYHQSRDALRVRDLELKERPWYAFLSKMIIGESEAAFMKQAMVESIMLANRTGLACRLYKSRTGRYPGTLDELVPGLLAEVPIDPFTGKPMVYRREGEGFVVYSLGSNQKDDGGRSTYMITQLVMDKDDDWSWREDR
jgi:hypothetical protein